MKFIKGLLLIFIYLLIFSGCEQEKLSYIKDESTHHEFIIDEDTGYVTFRDVITVKNNTNKKISFIMKADITREKEFGLTKENYAYAYDKNNKESYKVFNIKPNSKKMYTVYFIATLGVKKQKTDREPVDDLIFEIQ